MLWSPPHLLGIVGLLGLGSAILVQVHGHRRGWADALAGALILAAANFVVVEYDTDVPQFGVVWYLPVLVLAASVAFAIIELATASRWAVTWAAATHLGLVLVVAGFLELQGFSTPALPLLVLPGVLYDLGRRRGCPPAVQAAVLTLGTFVAYVFVRGGVTSSVSFDPGAVAVGVPVAALAAWSVLRVVRASRWMRVGAGRVAGTTGVAVLMLVGLTEPKAALAHDPGQGPDAGAVAMRIVVRDARPPSSQYRGPPGMNGLSRAGS